MPDSRKYSFRAGGKETIMAKHFDLNRYGMAVCPLCRGKGFSLKLPESTGQLEKNVCPQCGGFGAVSKRINKTKDQEEKNNLIWQ
jgi:hypothetical protein